MKCKNTKEFTLSEVDFDELPNEWKLFGLGENGKIRAGNSYGNDSYPKKDTK